MRSDICPARTTETGEDCRLGFVCTRWQSDARHCIRWSSRFNIHDVRFEVVRAITYTQYILNVRFVFHARLSDGIIVRLW